MPRFKMVIVFIVVVFFCLPAVCQLNKGDWMVGGDAAFSYSQANEYGDINKIFTFRLSPDAGYFFFDRFAGGLRLDGNITSTHYGTGKYRDYSISVAPFVRYYFLPMAQKVNLFADAGYGFVSGKRKIINFPEYDYSYHAGVISFKAGPAIFLNKHTALEITAGYSYSTRGPIDTVATNTIQIGIGFQIHLGK